MTVDEILRAFERAKELPTPALSAAVAGAPALAPRIIELVRKAAGGTEPISKSRTMPPDTAVTNESTNTPKMSIFR